MAARYAAAGGRRVCLLERKKTVGVPVRCGEGIGLKGLSCSVEVQPQWILSRIRRVSMTSPSGVEIVLRNIDESYVVDRTIMDRDLVEHARNAGAEYRPAFPVEQVVQEGETRYRCSGPAGSVTCAVVVLAEGIESRLARGLGWRTLLKSDDLTSCAFAQVTHDSIEEDLCRFYTGRKTAPGGYAWVFPRGKGSANVGLGILGSHCRAGQPQDMLRTLVARLFPGGKLDALHCGGVPVARWLRPLVREGVMLVGDAARQVNCLSGAGIAYGMVAGRIAGSVAANAFSGEMVEYRSLRRYERQWASSFGKQQDRSHALKSMVMTFQDRQLDQIARSLRGRDSKKLGYLRVFMRTFARHPLLLFKAVRLFA
jgi:digeranylgeranylglycerophospholipid reductase